MKGPERFGTARLVLRKPTRADAEAIYHRYASDPQVTRFLGWPRHRMIDDTRAFLECSEAQWHQHPAGPYLIESGAGVLLGSTALEFRSAGDLPRRSCRLMARAGEMWLSLHGAARAAISQSAAW
jgi:RimJ/RimL family protein N-acetyltransferase